MEGSAADGAASVRDGAGDLAGLGEITAGVLREVFPEWRIYANRDVWLAFRDGLQEKDGPRSLLMRALRASDLTGLAERLCLQEWLDG
jgi:hypothetical protein